MAGLKDKRGKVLRIVVAASLACGLVLLVKGLPLETGEKSFMEPGFLPDPPQELEDVLGAFDKFFTPREKQEQGDASEARSSSIVEEITQEAKEKIVEEPKEVVREKAIEVLKRLIEKLTSEEQTKEKVCEEVCREVCP